jgi:GNAT superfamily N-acetyltransferase
MDSSSPTLRISRRRQSPIRGSTKADIEVIHDWLQQEKARGVRDNFLCNWNVILKAHQEHKLLVYIDPQMDVPVGFQLGAFVEPGILEVRSDQRRRGVGRKLVEHRIAQARRKNEGLLYIQCKPSSSIPFWRKMGFTLVESQDSGTYAYRVLEQKHEFPPCGSPVSVGIRFYPEEAKWNPAAQPLTVAAPTAKVYEDGVIRLSERVYCFARLFPDARDVVVEVVVNGEVRYRNKAKYEDAGKIGIQECSNGFFIDRILPTVPK